MDRFDRLILHDIKKINRDICCLWEAIENGGGGSGITVVETCGDLPDATLHTGEFYYVTITDEGGCPFGLYYSNGAEWINDVTEILNRLSILEQNVYKITYYEIVSGTSGTITPPTGATFNSDEFGDSGDSILSRINGANKPTFENPTTVAGVVVTANLNTVDGTWTTSGTYTDGSVALIYSINITAENYNNLNNFYIIESEEIDYWKQLGSNLYYDKASISVGTSTAPARTKSILTTGDLFVGNFNTDIETRDGIIYIGGTLPSTYFYGSANAVDQKLLGLHLNSDGELYVGIYNDAYTVGSQVFGINRTGITSIGTTQLTDAQLNVRSTTTQLSLQYNNSNKFSTTIASNGLVTFDAVGAGAAFYFNDVVGIDSLSVSTLLQTDGSKNLISITDGINGQYLSTNGAGVYSWTTIPFPGLTIGSTTISNGTVGRILYEGAGNVLEESANLLWDTGSVRLGIGVTPLVTIHAASLTEQLRLEYDVSNYFSTTVGSTGIVTFDTNGVGASFYFNDIIGVDNLTASEIVITNSSKQLVSAAVATYPSLTELSYLKGIAGPIGTTYLPLVGATYTTTTGDGLALTTSTLTTGNLVSLSSTSTLAASSTQTVLNIATSGANGTSAQTTYAAKFSNSHTGTTSTNVAVYAYVTGGATANYAYVADMTSSSTSAIVDVMSFRNNCGSSTIAGFGVGLDFKLQYQGTPDSQAGRIYYTHTQVGFGIKTDLYLQVVNGGSLKTLARFSGGNSGYIEFYGVGVSMTSLGNEYLKVGYDGNNRMQISCTNSAAVTFSLQYNAGTVHTFNFDHNVGVGTGTTVSARLHAIATTEQLRLGYNISNYLSIATDSVGNAAFSLTGTSPVFKFVNSQLRITVSTGSQFRIENDIANYMEVTTSTTGVTTLTNVSATNVGRFIFSKGISYPYVAKTGTYAISVEDFTIDCTANSFTVTLPTAVGFTGIVFNIINSGSGTITVATTSSQTIGNITPTTTWTINPGEVINVQSDGANWKFYA